MLEEQVICVEMFPFVVNNLSPHTHTFYAHTMTIRVHAKNLDFEGQRVLERSLLSLLLGTVRSVDVPDSAIYINISLYTRLIPSS